MGKPTNNNPTKGIAGNPLATAIGNFYIFKSDSVSLGSGTHKITHGIGIIPADGDGIVILTRRTGTFQFGVSASDSQTVTITADGAVVVDICVIAFHSIIR
jgi:hypothetical protein